MMDLLNPVFLVMFIAWFLGGFVNGVAGLGAALVAMPLVAFVVDIRLAILSCCICGLLISVSVALMYRKNCVIAVILAMLLGTIPGALVGVLILKIAPTALLEIILGILLLFFVGWQWVDKRPRAQHVSLPGAFVAGFGSGFFNASVSCGGPPIAVYTTFSGMDRDTSRSTLSVFSFALCVVTAIAQASAGLYTKEILTLALYGLPGACCGLLASIPVARSIRESTFRKLLFALITASGCILIVRAIT